MAIITGIELKPESCVLAAVRASRGGGISVSALHIVEPTAWPGHDGAVPTVLKSVRNAKRLPRRARVVVWGLPDPVSLDDPTTSKTLQPIVAAGFRVEAVMSPPQALAALAASRPRDAGSGAVAWLAINMNGAAIAIMRGAELLFARSFDWLYTPGVAGSTAQLLQRYTLVAHLAPELRHGMAEVMSAEGLTVEVAVTCGDLPDLRSLTMPLIEELDLEVETLDSTDGLRATGRARQERFAEWAPTIRLACAAGAVHAAKLPRPPAGRGSFVPVTAAVAAVVLAGVGYVRWSAPAPPPVHSPATTVRQPSTASPSPSRMVSTLPSRSAGAAPSPVVSAPPSRSAGAAPSPMASPPSRSTSVLPPVGAVPKPSLQLPATPPPGGAQTGRATGTPAGAVAGVSAAPRQTTVAPQTPLRPVPPDSAQVPLAVPPIRTAAPNSEVPPARSLEPSRTATDNRLGKAAPPFTAPPKPENARTPSDTRGASAVGSVVPPAIRSVSPPPIASSTPAPVSTPARADGVPGAPVSTPARADRVPGAPVAPRPAPSRGSAPRPRLKDALPRIDSILVDRERRLAIIDGSILTVGDEVGPRTVVRIDRDGVVLREPSGVEVRVPLGSGGSR